MEFELDIAVLDHSTLKTALIGDDGRMKDRVDLADGVRLSPLFTSFRKAGAVGGADILTFLINIPVGVAINVAAAVLYDWMKERGIRRMRVNGIEVNVTDKPEETVPAVERALDQVKGGQAE